jgi:hypothetical protein
MEVLVLCGAYTGRPICLGGGRQNVHAAVAISEETRVHFQGWSRAMSRTRDPRQAMDWGSCSPRKLESATVSLRQTAREVRRFFSIPMRCRLLIGLGALLRDAWISSDPYNR